MLKLNKKCSSKTNSYLLKREKRSECHVLLERKNHITNNVNIKNKV